MHNLHEHWQKRVRGLRPALEPSVREFLREFARERDGAGSLRLLRKARQLLAIFSPRRGEEASAGRARSASSASTRASRRDPFACLARGQIFLTVEPDDPAPSYLRAALGDAGTRLCGMALDYGHWDATLAGCVALVTERPGIDAELARRLLADNALAFYGPRLALRLEKQGIARSA